MKKNLPLILFYILLAISCRFYCFSKDSFSRYQRSVYTENYLTEKKINNQKNLIVPEYIGKFPFNVIIEIPAQIEDENFKTEDSINQVIFAFTQDFFIKNPDFIISFINNTKNSKLPYSSTILLSADDEKNILETKIENSNATTYYTNRLYETNSICAFIINDEDYSPYQILTTGAGYISPMWIVRSVQKSFQANQKFINVQQSIIYKNKNHLFKNNSRLSAFCSNEIISTSFPLGHSNTDLDILNTIQKDIITTMKQGGNTHYNIIPTRFFSIWINESLLTLIYLAFACFVLITVCFSSFAYNAKNEAIIKDLSRTCFFAPCYIILSSIILTIFQWIFSATSNTPILFFSLKTIFTICSLFSIATLHHYYKFRISLSSITFQLFILCAINIFIFTFIDFSLMFVFIIEYFIILIASKTNKKTIALLVLFIMTFPFFLPATSIYLNIKHDCLINLFRTTFSNNFIFSLILIPITFQWIRCILLFNFKDRKNSGKKTRILLFNILFSSTIAILLFIIFLISTKLYSNNLTSEKTYNKISINKNLQNKILIDYSTSDNFDLITHKLNIKTNDNSKILRTFITLNSNTNPLYECNFNYTMKSTKEAFIEIPDGAEDFIPLIFSSDYNVPIHVKMDFYILQDEKNVNHEIKEIDLTGIMNDRRTF